MENTAHLHIDYSAVCEYSLCHVYSCMYYGNSGSHISASLQQHLYELSINCALTLFFLLHLESGVRYGVNLQNPGGCGPDVLWSQGLGRPE